MKLSTIVTSFLAVCPFVPALKAELIPGTDIEKLAKLEFVSDLVSKEDFTANDEMQNIIKTLTQAAIDGTQFECEDGTLGAFVDSLFADLTSDELEVFDYLSNDLRVQDWFSLSSYLVDLDPSSEDSFYPNKQQGKEYNKRFGKMKKFWDEYSPGIKLYSLSPNIIDNDAVMQELLQFFFGVNETTAQIRIQHVRDLFDLYPNIGRDFPLWSLNAIAYQSPFTGNGIAMGDGYVQILESVGLGGEGPDYILMHEFAHHIQYETGVFEQAPYTTFETQAESTRYSELMADALAAYYAIHARGATFRKKRVEEIAQTAFNIGDCNFVSPGHHGTPNQRAKAVEFAYDLIDSHPNQGQPMDSNEVIAAFQAQYDLIIAPDAN